MNGQPVYLVDPFVHYTEMLIGGDGEHANIANHVVRNLAWPSERGKLFRLPREIAASVTTKAHISPDFEVKFLEEFHLWRLFFFVLLKFVVLMQIELAPRSNTPGPTIDLSAESNPQQALVAKQRWDDDHVATCQL